MIGGLLLKLESQSSVILIFSLTLVILTWSFYVSIVWVGYKPILSLFIWLWEAIIIIVMLTKGESLPTEYADYKLGYFWKYIFH